MTDQCNHCSYKGDLSACKAAECHKHDDWYPMQLQKEVDELKASIPKIKAETIDELLADLDYSEQGLGCGVEDRGITDRYEAARYGYEECLEKIAFYANQLEGK